MPGDLVDTIRAIPKRAGPRRTLWPVALAASFLVAVGAAGVAWQMNQGWDSVEDYVADHYRHDGDRLVAIEAVNRPQDFIHARRLITERTPLDVDKIVATETNVAKLQVGLAAVQAGAGTQFDQLFDDGDVFSIGGLKVRVVHTPGHTPACVTYVIGDAAFVGDTLFMPDFGSARTDFPGGSAGQLYDSIQKILALPDDTRLFMCHDYKAPGRDVYAWETSVAEQRASNIHINDTVSRDAFVEMREGRDRQLGMPKLILPSLQVNLRAGRLPEPEDNDIRYLKIPLDAV